MTKSRYEVKILRSDGQVGLDSILSKVFGEVCKVCDLHNEWHAGEFPFWYNEQASVSTLCSALNATGFPSLSEYMCMKRNAADKRRKYAGRTDLWFGNLGSGRCYGAEVKQFWCHGVPRLERLMSRMEDAEEDAKQLDSQTEVDFRLAILIVTANMFGKTKKTRAEYYKSVHEQCRQFSQDRWYNKESFVFRVCHPLEGKDSDYDGCFAYFFIRSV